MLITTDRAERLLGILRNEISKMRPGQCFDISVTDLRDIQSYEHNGATFTAADRILGGIMGAAYTHSYEVVNMGQVVRFTRYENTGERRYQDPDHDIRLVRLNRERTDHD